MRRAAPAVVLAGCSIALCGCTGAPAQTAAAQDEPVAGARVVALLTAADSGGSGGLVAARLDLAGAIPSYSGQFRRPLRTRVAATAGAAVKAGGQVYGQVVSQDCDVPAGVQVVRRNGSVVILPGPAVPEPGCTGSSTTVAIVALPTR